MKITHNKVGQNLNLIDGVKQDKASGASSAKGAKDLKANEVSLDKASGASTVDVSEKAQQAKRIKELAMATPDMDMAKVEKFRKLIDEGKYKVDSRAVADKLVDDHMETAND